MEIRNLCGEPPPLLVQHVRRCVKLFSYVGLDGIGSIVLLDAIPSLYRPWISKMDPHGLGITGWYERRTDSKPASITLNIGEIRRGLPYAFWLTPAGTILIMRTLAHEVGHHVIAKGDKKGPNLRVIGKDTNKLSEEESAELYARKIGAAMGKEREYRLFLALIEKLAVWHYGSASANYHFHRFRNAANNFYLAWRLDPDGREDAWRWFEASRARIPNERKL